MTSNQISLGHGFTGRFTSMSQPLPQDGDHFERFPQVESGFSNGGIVDVEHLQIAANTAHGQVVSGEHGADHADSGLHVVFIPDNIGSFLGYDFSNTLLTSIIASVFLIAMAYFVGKRITSDGVPGKLQIFFEGLVGYIHDEMAKILGNDRVTTIAFPLIITLFLYILVANWIEFIPGVGSFEVKQELSGGKEKILHLLRGPNADLNMTLALAIISFVFIEFMGFRTQGLAYLKNFFNFSSPINFFVGLIELISELARLISLSFRLFGNIFAGEIIVLLAITLQAIVTTWFVGLVNIAQNPLADFFGALFPFPVPVMLFEMGVGVLQAAVFAMLTLFFVKQATTAHQH